MSQTPTPSAPLSEEDEKALRDWAEAEALPPPISNPTQTGWIAQAVLKLLDRRPQADGLRAVVEPMLKRLTDDAVWINFSDGTRCGISIDGIHRDEFLSWVSAIRAALSHTLPWGVGDKAMASIFNEPWRPADVVQIGSTPDDVQVKFRDVGREDGAAWLSAKDEMRQPTDNELASYWPADGGDGGGVHITAKEGEALTDDERRAVTKFIRATTPTAPPQTTEGAGESEFDNALASAQEATKRLGNMPKTELVREGPRTYEREVPQPTPAAAEGEGPTEAELRELHYVIQNHADGILAAKDAWRYVAHQLAERARKAGG